MTLDIKTLINLLHFENSLEFSKLKNLTFESINDSKVMHSIAERQCKCCIENSCYECGNEPGCLILTGFACLASGELKSAIEKFENANQHFQNEGETLNHAIGLIFIGKSYENLKNEQRAFHAYEKARKIIESYLLQHEKHYTIREKILPLKAGVDEKLAELNPYTVKDKPAQPSQARLAFPWIPAYTGLQAGPNGPIWIGSLPKDGGSFVDEIILEDKPHEIYSVKSNDHIITLTSDKEYAWAKVSGNSMNDAKPTSILEDDFVLFYKSGTADHHSIVIASHAEDKSAGNQHVVKRYSQNEQAFLSETKSPNSYPPMPITNHTKIIGVVIAVAKPKDRI